MTNPAATAAEGVMTDDGLDRGSSYRRRLARAAAASFALHMIFFGGLSVSRLDFATEQPADAEATNPEKRKKAADFRLQVSRSATAERPAHERALTLPVPTDAARPAESRERPTEQSVADRREVAPEAEPTVMPSRTEFERSRPDDQQAPSQPSEALERVADVTPTESRATADMAAAAAATESSDAAEAAPATAQPRDRGESGPIAARWRPREVALLEKLTARAPDASSLAARPAADAPAPARSTAISRRSTANAARPSTVRADAIAPAPTQATSSASAASPQPRDTARRPAPATAAASRPAIPAAATSPSSTAIATASPALASITRSQALAGSTASAAAGSRSPARSSSVKAGEVAGAATVAAATGAAPAVASSGVGGLLAPAAAASGGSRSGRQGARGSAASERSAAGGSARAARAADGGGSADNAVAAGTVAGQGRGAGGLADLGGGLTGGREGLVDGGAGTAAGSRSPGRDTGNLASDPTGSGGLVAVDPTGGGGPGQGGGLGQRGGSELAAAGGGGPGGLGTGLMPAAMDRGGRRGGSRSAVASRGGGRNQGDGASEGLSVSPADIAAVVAAGRQRAAASSQPQGPRSLERITTAALPTDGRVRDVAEAFASRSGGGSEPAGGITDRETLDRARAMVDRGLAFLVRSQLADGRWRLTEYAGVTPADKPKLESDTAATGLALLCFLGAGHDHFSGPHRDTVRRGLEFLMTVQRDDGDLFLPADDLSNSCGWLYSHGIASIAVCEAVGMTGDPLVKPAAEKACRFIATSRHPTLGGWRYVPRTDADLSVSGWMLVALRAGDLAGVQTDPAALDAVRMLVDASASPSDPTRYAYNVRKADQRRTDLSVACMTAVGTLMRLHTGATADDPRVIASSKLLAGLPPSYGTKSQRVRDSYLWYYASQVLVHTGGDDWQAWYAELVDTLEEEQRKDGPLAGSWDAMGEVPDRWGEYGGRLYVTTLHLLALEVPWRHLPTYATAPSR